MRLGQWKGRQREACQFGCTTHHRRSAQVVGAARKEMSQDDSPAVTVPEGEVVERVPAVGMKAYCRLGTVPDKRQNATN